MSARSRMVSHAAFATLAVLIVALCFPFTRETHAEGSLAGKLAGQTVVVFFSEYPATNAGQIMQLEGKVDEADAHGFWFTSSKRWFLSGASEAYTGSCYLPWSAVSFIKKK